jgi:RNA polymerase sigma-70 factor, ECF subfamily
MRSAHQPSDGQDCLERAYTEHGGEIYGFCRRQLGDAGLAEEVTQNAFVRAWKARDRFDAGRGSLQTWLFQIARNAAIDAHRARSIRPGVAEETGRTAAASIDVAAGLADRMVLIEALAALSPDHRSAVLEVHVRGRSYSEVAEQFDIPVGTVKSRVFTGLRQLQSTLAELNRQGDDADGGAT